MGQYSTAVSQGAKAAFIESGGQAEEDRINNYAQKRALVEVHNLGITDKEIGGVGVAYGAYKAYKAKQIDINGPKVLYGRIHLTCSPSGGSMGIRWEY